MGTSIFVPYEKEPLVALKPVLGSESRVPAGRRDLLRGTDAFSSQAFAPTVNMTLGMLFLPAGRRED
jgi:hypothetical protein